MPRLEGDADLAVSLEAADARAVPGARVDDDEGPAQRVDRNARRRYDPHQAIVDGPPEGAAVNDELRLVVEHMRKRNQTAERA
jgi:hypothetical protein